MKTTTVVCGLMVLSLVSIAKETVRPLPPEVLKIIPSKFDLKKAEFSDAKKELEALVTKCGPGVVQGTTSENGEPSNNQCAFQVKMDELFFKPLRRKTGLLHDRRWAYRDGVTFFEPKASAVPDNFDLRDLMKNGQPELREQDCGDCWAWATHHGLELARAVHDEQKLDHSVQTVLSCSRAGSCNGGYMRAVDFLVHGLPYEPEFPYAGRNKTCKYSSADIERGWEGKIVAAPYVGSSHDHSRAKMRMDGSFRGDGTKVQKIMEAIYQWKSPVVVTVEAYSISGSGVYNSCSAINSGGNHMVAIVGWEKWNEKRVAHVWNSWGPDHGENGVSRIRWECGEGRLNRGLGYSAKIVQYTTSCLPPEVSQPAGHSVQRGESVLIGKNQRGDTKCSWAPTTGLSDPDSCETLANPNRSTEYHLTATNSCGTASSMILVRVPRELGRSGKILTPFGEIEE